MAKRKFLEIEKVTAEKVRLYCFLRGISIKKFVTETMEKELEPYKGWLEEIKKIKPEKTYAPNP